MMKMSVIVIAHGDPENLRGLLAALKAQTVASELEIVLVGPEPHRLFQDSELADFAGFQRLRGTVIPSSSEARTTGVKAARAPVVAFVEDHCFPLPGWAEALIERHQEEWSGVGPVVLNGNPRTATSWGNYLIEYGDWAYPIEGGASSHIPGHNSSYKREALLSLEPHLADLLEAETTMQWKMAAFGHRFFLEPEARARHYNFSKLSASLGLRFFGGWLFGANRFAPSDSRRFLYLMASPLIPFVRFKKVLVSCRRLGKSLSWCLARLPLMFALLLLDGLGEAMGYATNQSAYAMAYCSNSEIDRARYLSSKDREFFNREAAVHHR